MVGELDGLTDMSTSTLKFIQIVLALLIGIGLLLLIGQKLWVPKVVKFKLEQEGIYHYYVQATDSLDNFDSKPF